MEITLTIIASLFAGLVDSIVGGGGLILVPVLFSAFPGAAPADLFGTNKSASVWGTAVAAAQYGKRVTLRWRGLFPAAVAAFAGSFAGAWTVTVIDPGFMRRLLPFVLLALFVYTVMRKNLGGVHAPTHPHRRETLLACAIGMTLGWYDGFFGPGTGSLFVFLFVRVLGYDFLHASAAAKVLNVATNVAALSLFAAKGHVWWKLGAAMAAANIIGSLVGTRLALKHGTGFVRGAFIVVVGVLILKTGYDAFVK
ncbi:MAG: hypothetical protein K0S28_503 [Paucimonas sp.]|jgi:uncharacterized membrane protein YfcA|nr:hypothetical protein [Paucimonas sp.]